MAYTQADVDRLKSIRAQGAKSVTFSDGRRVEYNSPEELDLVIAQAEASLSSSTSGRSTVAVFARE